MESRLVETITSNEEDTRFRIFNGDLPAEDGVKELLRIERAQAKNEQRRLLRKINELQKNQKQMFDELSHLAVEEDGFFLWGGRKVLLTFEDTGEPTNKRRGGAQHRPGTQK